MKRTTLFRDDDNQDTPEDWKDGAASDLVQSPDNSKRDAWNVEQASEKAELHPQDQPTGSILNSRQNSPQPKPYHNGSQPSRAAAESARRFVRSQASRVLDFIAKQGERGATDKEIQTGLGMDGNSQRPRRVWLREQGFIQAKGHPEDITIRDGSTVWVATLPPEQSVGVQLSPSTADMKRGLTP
ncbi:MAG: hypothetical protein U0936_23450 [Planctomycetaceae bacterium]